MADDYAEAFQDERERYLERLADPARPLDQDSDPALEAHWWKAWYAADFSWEGLAKIPWRAPSGWPGVSDPDAANLQDYWRVEWVDGEPLALSDGELKSSGLLRQTVDKRLWHVAHYPLYERPTEGEAEGEAPPPIALGAVTAKHADYQGHDAWSEDDHGRLQALITERIARAGDPGPEDDEERARKEARRGARYGSPALLDGVVHTRPLESPAATDLGGDRISVSLALSRLVGDLNFERRHLVRGLRLHTCWLEGRAKLEAARFSGALEADGARIGALDIDQVTLRSSRSGLGVDLENAIVIRHVRAQSARIGGDARFARARIGGDAGFARARIGGDAWFARARIGGDARFARARIGGDARFARARIGGDALFASAIVLRDFSLKGSRSDADEGDGEDVEAWETRLPTADAFGSLDFRNARVWGRASFEDRVFRAKPDFTGARFLDVTTFHGATIHEGAEFDPHLFALAPGWEPEHPRTIAEAFSAEAAEPDDRFAALRIRGAKIDDAVDIARRMNAVAADRAPEWRLDEQSQGKRVEADAELARRRTTFARCFPGADQDALDDAEALLRAYARRVDDLKERRALKKTNPKGYDTVARDFEHAFQRLKRAMAELHRRGDEQEFFARELKSRMQRVRGLPTSEGERDTAPGYLERLAAGLYGLVSNYGRSIVRPLITLLALAVIMTVANIATALWSDVDLRTDGFSSAAASDLRRELEPTGATSQTAAPETTEAPPPRRAFVGAVFTALNSDEARTVGDIASVTTARSLFPLAGVRTDEHPWLAKMRARRPMTAGALEGVHKLLSAITLFLLALTIRRRFQLS